MERSTHLRPAAGFSLLETVVALSLMAVVILSTLAILGLVPRVERRLDAHREVLQVLEAEMEALRATASTALLGEVDLSLRDDPVAAEGLRIEVEVEALPERSLRRVELRASYRVAGQDFERSLETMVFSP